MCNKEQKNAPVLHRRGSSLIVNLKISILWWCKDRVLFWKHQIFWGILIVYLQLSRKPWQLKYLLVNLQLVLKWNMLHLSLVHHIPNSKRSAHHCELPFANNLWITKNLNLLYEVTYWHLMIPPHKISNFPSIVLWI